MPTNSISISAVVYHMATMLQTTRLLNLTVSLIINQNKPLPNVIRNCLLMSKWWQQMLNNNKANSIIRYNV